MNKAEQLRLQIAGLKARIRWLQEGLPYTDHGAYGQDRERIRLAQQELTTLQTLLAREEE